MTTIPISEARNHLSEIANRVAFRGERVVVERRGRHLFAVVPIEDLELLEHIEDKVDLEAIRRAKDQPGRPWEDVKADLGL